MLVHGIVVTRDDWGLLAISICNALLHHVDVIHVLNHGSQDQTAAGLGVLADIWGERLQLYSVSQSIPFNQSLLTNMMASFAEKRGADWIYVFDSDEILLANQKTSLKQELSKLNSQTVGIKYNLSNFISTSDFDRMDLTHYKKLIYKSRPNATYDPSESRDSIYTGRSTFFDVPFPPKIIFRAKQNLLLDKGAHALPWTSNGKTVAQSTELECAHLTLICRDALERKIRQGEFYIKSGNPKNIGWQMRLLYELHQEGRIEWFWQRHSIHKEPGDAMSPCYSIERCLVETLDPTIELLTKAFGGTDLAKQSREPLKRGHGTINRITLDDAIEACGYFENKIRLVLNTLNQKPIKQ